MDVAEQLTDCWAEPVLALSTPISSTQSDGDTNVDRAAIASLIVFGVIRAFRGLSPVRASRGSTESTEPGVISEAVFRHTILRKTYSI